MGREWDAVQYLPNVTIHIAQPPYDRTTEGSGIEVPYKISMNGKTFHKRLFVPKDFYPGDARIYEQLMKNTVLLFAD